MITTEALVLSCMDFRLVDALSRFMASLGLAGDYDHVTLAGSALAATNDEFPIWREVFWQHVQLARDLHRVRRLIVVDHRDCGAYRAVLGEDFAKDRRRETQVHAERLRKLRAAVADIYPDLAVELYLMDLEGTAERID